MSPKLIISKSSQLFMCQRRGDDNENEATPADTPNNQSVTDTSKTRKFSINSSLLKLS